MRVLAAATFLVAFLALAEEKSLLKPTNKVESWRFEQHEGSKGSIKAEGEAIVFTVDQTGSANWHVQAVQHGLDLMEGKTYVLKLQIKASDSRSVGIAAMIDQDDWHTIGLAEEIFVGKEFITKEFSFRAQNVVAKKNRIGLTLGEAKGTVTVKDMTLTQK